LRKNKELSGDIMRKTKSSTNLVTSMNGRTHKNRTYFIIDITENTLKKIESKEIGPDFPICMDNHYLKKLRNSKDKVKEMIIE
jgi:hypothetical protein